MAHGIAVYGLHRTGLARTSDAAGASHARAVFAPRLILPRLISPSRFALFCQWGQRALRFSLLLICSLCAALTHAQSLQLDLDAVSGTGWSARKVQLALAIGSTNGARGSIGSGGSAKLDLKGLHAQGRDLGDVSIACARFSFENRILQCEDGHLQGAVRWPLSFSYDLARKALRLSITPEKDEVWHLDIAGGEWRVNLNNASLARIAPLLPAPSGAAAASIRPTAGRVTGTLRYGPARIDADLRVSEAAFADSSGLRAGEKLQGRGTLDATRAGMAWNWQAALQWDQGAVFWDPLYIVQESGVPGHRFSARGTQAGGRVTVEQAVLDWHGLGQLTGSAAFAIGDPALGQPSVAIPTKDSPPDKDSPSNRFVLSAHDLQLAGLRALLPQTWLDQHALGDLTLKGTADFSLRGAAGEIAEATLRLADASFNAPQRGLALERLDMQWTHAPAAPQPQPFTFNLDALRVRDLAFGPIRASGESRGGRLHIPSLVVPLLDGFLGLSDINIGRDAFGLQGALTPVSMEKLTAALGWHPLGGQLAFVLPQVKYSASTMAVDGALLFKLFGGDASVEAIRLENPFGRTPQLTADLHLKRLNLEEMTGAVKFGRITGFVDVAVEGLVMENWQPVSMDARVVTSEGAFAKRISQRAVQNISSIGGAGAGAAIQRSFLGFFETFGYERIGLSCRLRNGVCLMGDGTPSPPGASAQAGAGAESASGSFTLIKGGGLPAVNVVGYNRFVGWQELLDRIKAVIDGNSRPVFQ